MFPTSVQILVVDDATTSRELVKKMLRALGYSNFHEAKSGNGGYLFLTSRAATDPAIDLILTDYSMPNGTGLDLLRQVRADARYKNTPVVMITAEGMDSTINESVEAGVNAYLVKPVVQSALEETLKQVWENLRAAA